jgi:hypothetical protein
MNTTVSNKRVSNKNKLSTNKPTLDVQHNQYLTKIESMQVEKEKLQDQIEEYDRKLEILRVQLESVNTEQEQELLISEVLKLKDDRLDAQDSIKQIDDSYDINKYLTSTADILFQYYDVIEKGTHNGNDQNNVNTSKNNHEHSILKYFGSSGPNTQRESEMLPKETHHTHLSNSTPNNNSSNSRGTLLDMYLKMTCPNYIDPTTIQAQSCPEVCSYCKSSQIMIMVNDGYILCNSCNNIEYIIIDHEKPSYRDPPKEISFYAYKRSNHLNEWLSQIQGKETTDIPEEVYDKILVEIKKQKITNMAQITPKKIREILRKLQINKYEHIPHIINRLTGRPTLQMPPELEDKLRNMFKQVQAPFLKHAPANRKNFLSYSYCLYKMLQLLGEDQYLNSLSLLKSRDKTLGMDALWRKICSDLDWEFIPSL